MSGESMSVPEHVRTELMRLMVLVEHHQQILAQLQAQQAQLVKVSTGVDVSAGDWQLNPTTWELSHVTTD